MNMRYDIKRVALLAVLFLTIGTLANATAMANNNAANATAMADNPAKATSDNTTSATANNHVRAADSDPTVVDVTSDILYVITDADGNYLANVDGAITKVTATAFNPTTCAWTCSAYGSGTLKIGDKYLGVSNGSLTLTDSGNTTWTVNSDNTVSCTSGSTTYYIYSNGSSWATATSSSDITVASCHSVTLSDNTAASSMTINYDEFSSSFGRPDGGTRTYSISNFSYTPAHLKYSWANSEGTQVNYYANAGKTYISQTAPAAIAVSDATIAWTTSDGSHTSITADTDDQTKAVAAYTSKYDTDSDVTFTATATVAKDKSNFLSDDVTFSATTTATMYARKKSDLTLELTLDDNFDDLYINNTATLKVTKNTSGAAVTFSMKGDATATIADATDESGTAVVKKITATGTGGTNAAELLITATAAQTDEYDAAEAAVRVVINKRPTAVSLKYDSESYKNITYGDSVPTLTESTVKDVCGASTSDIEGAKLSYTSDNLCVDVKVKTGKLTVNYAGTATITATYDGDDTYAKASATFKIAVAKKATTLTFPESEYFAQIGKSFTAPTATLNPSEAGDVTYSYVSDTENLISIDSKTGAVTLSSSDLTGRATVTATFAGDNRYEASSASYTLVVDTKVNPELTVDVSPTDIYVDQTGKVTCTTKSDNGVTMESTDTGVFTVGTDGTIKPVNEGVATLRVTSVEDDTYMEYTVEKTITVKRYAVKLTLKYPQDGVFYSDREVNDIPPTVSAKREYDGTSVDLKDFMIFSTEQTSVISVNETSGNIKLLGPGYALVTLYYVGNYYNAPATVTYPIQVKYAAGPGHFLRIKDADGHYLSCSNDKVGTSDSEDASSIIWYGTDRSLLFYSCGHYLKDADKALADVLDAGKSGPAFHFSHDGDEYIIKDDYYKTMASSTSGDSVWTVTTVDNLPLKFNSAGHGFSTFYSPAELRCPAGVTAYYPATHTAAGNSSADYVITLKAVIGNYIPPLTPVVLYTMDTEATYQMYLIEEEHTKYSDQWDGLVGTLSAITTSSVYSGTQPPYTLQPTKDAETVGFYPWKSDSHTTISGFRCYIPGSEVSDAKSFRFVIDDGSQTGIDTVSPSSDESSSSIIYNLQGVAVGKDINALPSGVYIRGGKKIVKK